MIRRQAFFRLSGSRKGWLLKPVRLRGRGRAITMLAVAMIAGIGGAKAQYSMSTTGRSANPSVEMSIRPGSIDAHIVNDAEARMRRKAVWRTRNAVDFEVRFTGELTEYNKSWTNNNQNSKSGLLTARYYHTYTRSRHTSRFTFDGKYGLINVDKIWFKNNDWFKLYYSAGWSVTKEGFLRNWDYTFSTEFISQFTEGFKSRTDKTIWSNFLAPADLNLGLGFTYKSPHPKLPFIVTINPLSANMRFVVDDRIDPDRRRQLGIPVTMVSDPTTEDPNHQRPEYKNYKAEGGSNLKITFDRTFKPGGKKGFDLRYRSEFSSFYGWITQMGRRHGSTSPMPEIMPTVYWKNILSMRPLKFVSIDFITETAYDKSQVDKIQMKYFLQVGLVYGYKNR